MTQHRLSVTMLLSMAGYAASAQAQTTNIRQYVREHQPDIMREFIALVSLPNVRTDLPNIKRNAEQLRQMLERRGMKPEILMWPRSRAIRGLPR